MTLSLRGRVGLVRLRISRAMGWVSGAALASPVVLAFVHIAFHPWTRETWLPIWKTSLVGGAAMSLVLALAGALLAGIRPSTEGVLRVDGDDVVMETAGGASRIPLASVRSGVVVPRATGARIELSLASGDTLFADVSSLAEGERALRALGLDAAKRRCSIPLVPRASNVLRRVGWIVATVMVSFMVLGIVTEGRPATAASIVSWLGGTTLGVALATYLTRERAITVGADGVLLPGPWGARFVRFEEIQGVKAVGRTVRFELVGAADLVVKVGRTSRETAAVIALRAQEAIRARSAAPEAPTQLAMVSRGGRSLSEWRQAMERLAQRTQDYRGVALSSDDLVAILESRTASEEQRLGAAMGLAALGGEQHKDRLRIAANACAREPMRVALDKLAEGEVDERAVEEALDEADGAPKEGTAYM